MSQVQIALQLCVHKSLISRESKRNIGNEFRVGDWEIDLVIGKCHSGVLLTIVERLTRYSVTQRIFDKSARKVTDATIELLAPFIKICF